MPSDKPRSVKRKCCSNRETCYNGKTNALSAAQFIVSIHAIKERCHSARKDIETMSASNITKQALTKSFTKLMTEQPFEKISIQRICEECGLSRKCFYYHFRDKYDLVNWLFGEEFLDRASQKSYPDGWAFLDELCEYLYKNREFYRKVFTISGANSLPEHFMDTMRPLVRRHLTISFPALEPEPFYTDFLVDGSVHALIRWLQTSECSPPDIFLKNVKSIVQALAVKVCQDMEGISEADRSKTK